MTGASTDRSDGAAVHEPRTDATDTGPAVGGLAVNRSIAEPLADQLARQIRERIGSGEWPSHYRLPSEPSLADGLGVNRGTVRRALASLVEEHLLVTLRGRGTFVASGVVEPLLEGRFRSLSEDFREQGVVTRTQVVSSVVARLPLPVQALLDVPAGTPALRLERVFVGDEGPLAHLVNYVRLDLCPGIEDCDFTTRSLFDVLEQEHALRISDGRRTFAALGAPPDVAGHLAVPAGAPTLYLEQITYLDDGRPVEYSDVWISTARIKVTSVLRR